MERRRRYKPPRHPKTGFKTDLLIFCFAAVVLDFLFGVPDKAKQFAEDGLNAAVRTEVTAGAKNAQGGAGIAKMQAAAAAVAGR